VLPAMRENFGDVPNIDLMVRLVLTLPALFIGPASRFTLWIHWVCCWPAGRSWESP
jgi:hypothetical protein